MMAELYTTDQLASLLTAFCTENGVRSVSNVTFGIESTSESNEAASIFIIKAEVLEARTSALTVCVANNTTTPLESPGNSEQENSADHSVWESYSANVLSTDPQLNSLTAAAGLYWESELLDSIAGTAQQDHHGNYVAMHGSAGQVAQIFTASPGTTLAQGGSDGGIISTHSPAATVSGRRHRPALRKRPKYHPIDSTNAVTPPDQTSHQDSADTLLPHRDKSPPSHLETRLESARNMFLRDDCVNYIKAEILYWSNGALWQEANQSEYFMENGSELYRNLQIAYSMVCYFNTRMENDALRHRIALVELYNEYNTAYESWQNASEPRGVGRGHATCIIDQILQNTHGDWHTFGVQDRKALRARFHERKRYGKRWSLLVDEFGKGILFLCSRPLERLM
ncbi:hypothetical protein NLG97_g8221 [Lecanicillium saksenae]|uniref:Uncharacterized protein n=1 Tax=Lecanicillium saksenae TaxID=468837 RepID=A0ACC1QJI2_9HYPO|nr:hypothetical protein NLG97_g8221 [Lecanicillium saksenae]